MMIAQYQYQGYGILTKKEYVSILKYFTPATYIKDTFIPRNDIQYKGIY